MLFNQNQLGVMMGQNMLSTGPTSATPRAVIFDIESREVGTWTIKNNIGTVTPAFPTSGFPTKFKFNANGTTLAMCYSLSPYVYFYNKIGNDYSKLDDFAAGHIPNKTSQGVSWHPNNKYVAAVFDSNNNLGQCVVWERNGDTFTTITNTSSFNITATIAMSGCAWNPQGDTLILCATGAPYFLAYSFDESTKTFNKIVNPLDSTPTVRVDDLAWNHNGTSIALAAGNTSPRLWIYNRNSLSSTSTFTKLANPASLPTRELYGVAFGGTNSEYLVCNGNTSPYVHFYYRTGDTFNKAANPTTLPTGLDGNGIDINPEGTFVVSVHYNGPTTYFRRDTNTTNTWINIGGQVATGNYGRGPDIHPSFRI